MPASSPLTRAAADALVAKYDDAMADYLLMKRMGKSVFKHWARANACRERVLDAICQEERTEPLAGNERRAGE